MSLTATQRKRLAREARKLAMECVEGTAPPMISGLRWRDGNHCVLGWIEARSGLRRSADENYVTFPLDESWVAADANNDARNRQDRMLRLPFPLLALADALDPTP